MPLEDSRIIELFYARSEQAIVEVAKKYGAVCLRLAENISGSRRDAEECVNDAYLGAWSTIPPQSPDPLPTYLYRIVRNLATARYHANTARKRNSLYDAALDELEDCLACVEGTEETLAARELSALLDRFLATLERDERVLFVRRYWYAEPVTALAGQFGLRENTVSARLSRTRKKLRDYLRKEGYEI